MKQIQLKQVSKSFGDVEVIPPLDLEIEDGEFVVFVGPSGCGKSTLLRCANLLEICQAGDILFEGEAIAWRGEGEGREPASNEQIKALRTQLAMVFQQFNLWAHMTIVQNIVEAPVTVLGCDRVEMEALAMDLLNKVGIADKANDYPAQNNFFVVSRANNGCCLGIIFYCSSN